MARQSCSVPLAIASPGCAFDPLTRTGRVRGLTFADGGYAGEKLRRALEGHGDWTIEIIRRSDTADGFEVLPRRWVVERSFAWLGRCRRLARDRERTIESSTAWTLVASIRLMTRRLARYCYPV